MAANLEGLDEREDSDAAIRVVEAYQNRNSRVRRDKTYHLVISLHPDDRSLEDAELELVVRRAVKVAGLEGHQYIAVRHSDQEHEHVHVAVNKIHPETLNIHHPYRAIPRYKLLAAELEQTLGLRRVDRSKDRARTTLSSASRQFEATRGEQSFARWAHERIARHIDLGDISDWEELHGRLSTYGVRLVRRGNGLAVVDAVRTTARCKASVLGRQWSKGRLEDRFGRFVCGPSAEHVAQVQREPYRPKPLESLREDGLWYEYQRERTEARRVRAKTREETTGRLKRARDAQDLRFKLRHHAIEALPLARKDKRALYQSLGTQTLRPPKAKPWHTLVRTPQARTWKEFLAERAANGDLRAVRRLTRRHDHRAPGIRSNGRNALPGDGQKTSRGTRVHDIGHGVRIRESSGLLELVGDPSPEALAQLARLGEERFRGSCVHLLGSRAVREQLEQLVRERNLRTMGEREHER